MPDGTHRWGVELDDGKYGPARYAEIEAYTLTEAWIRATREYHRVPGNRVMVVFSLTKRPYEQASRLDYSNTTGSGDPH
jgi:hypothetical protein